MIEDKYRSKLFAVNRPQEQIDMDFKEGEIYSGDVVISAIHRYLPYRVPLNEFGISHGPTQWDNPGLPAGSARFERTRNLIEFMDATGPRMFTEVDELRYLYAFNPAGVFNLLDSYIYLRDPKMISILKLAFG